jgi:prophage regulatory protein
MQRESQEVLSDSLKRQHFEKPPGEWLGTNATLPAEGYVRLPTILAVFPVGRSTWWAGVKDGRFPQPVKLGPRTTAWKVADIRKLIEGPHENCALY